MLLHVETQLSEAAFFCFPNVLCYLEQMTIMSTISLMYAVCILLFVMQIYIDLYFISIEERKKEAIGSWKYVRDKSSFLHTQVRKLWGIIMTMKTEYV
jgi:hypothetical protein